VRCTQKPASSIEAVAVVVVDSVAQLAAQDIPDAAAEDDAISSGVPTSRTRTRAPLVDEAVTVVVVAVVDLGGVELQLESREVSPR
jgi:hypothetical protein